MGKRCGKFVEVVPLANRCYDYMITVKLFFTLYATNMASWKFYTHLGGFCW